MTRHPGTAAEVLWAFFKLGVALGQCRDGWQGALAACKSGKPKAVLTLLPRRQKLWGTESVVSAWTIGRSIEEIPHVHTPPLPAMPV